MPSVALDVNQIRAIVPFSQLSLHQLVLHRAQMVAVVVLLDILALEPLLATAVLSGGEKLLIYGVLFMN